jgi:hypothetical protein
MSYRKPAIPEKDDVRQEEDRVKGSDSEYLILKTWAEDSKKRTTQGWVDTASGPVVDVDLRYSASDVQI